MDPIIGGALISGAGSLLSGLFGNSAAKKQAAMQKEFAQNGIQWRVRDAEKAGVHPLYALGAQVTPYSPVSVGDPGFGAMGQDLSRAYMATRTEDQKIDAFTRQAQVLDLEGKRLNNELIKSQIARNLTPDNQAPFPGTTYAIPGQTQSGPVQNYEGPIPDVATAVTATGRTPVPGKEMAERMEDNWLLQIPWAIRNQLLPNLGMPNPPPDAPKGKEYIWNPARQEYILVDKGTRRLLKSAAPFAPF